MFYKFLDHSGDLKIFVKGKDLRGLFLNALQAMFSVITDKEISQFLNSKNSSVRQFNIFSPDLESLLVDFLSEAISYSDINHEFYFDAHFDNLDRNLASGMFFGLPLEKKIVEIKGVTYHDLKISQNKEKEWEATILFDL